MGLSYGNFHHMGLSYRNFPYMGLSYGIFLKICEISFSYGK